MMRHCLKVPCHSTSDAFGLRNTPLTHLYWIYRDFTAVGCADVKLCSSVFRLFLNSSEISEGAALASEMTATLIQHCTSKLKVIKLLALD